MLPKVLRDACPAVPPPICRWCSTVQVMVPETDLLWCCPKCHPRNAAGKKWQDALGGAK